MTDALDQAALGGWRGQRDALGEVYRVLRPGGSLLLGVPNRLGFGRAAGAGGERARSYWSYRGLLRRAGFVNIAFYAPLPSHHEPFFILPLGRWRIVNHFVDGLFTAQDYRFKLEARGLGAAYQLAWRLWRVGRRLRLTSLARYVTPSYLIVAQREGR
jgi:SAM-dependent methyltransferase